MNDFENRRAIAEALRGCAEDCRYFTAQEIEGCLDSGSSDEELFRRLADLIEPTCDRDALLRVAGELDATSDTPVGSVTLSTHVLWDWFDRIRAACGEVANEQTKDPRQA